MLVQIDLVKAVSKALAELNLVKSSEGTKFFLRFKKKTILSKRSFIKSIWNRLKRRKKEKKERETYDNDSDQVELTGYALVKTENVQRLIVASNDLIRFLFRQFCPQIHETGSEYRSDSFASTPEEDNVFPSYGVLGNLNRSNEIVNPEVKLQEAASNETLQQPVNELKEEQSKIDQCLLLTNCLIKPILVEQSFDKSSVLQTANSFYSNSAKSTKYENKSVLISIFDKMFQEKSKCNSFQDNRIFVRPIEESLYDKELQTADYYPSSESNKIVDSSVLVSSEKPIHAFSHSHGQLMLKEESMTDESFNLHTVADEFHSNSLKSTNGNASSILVTFGDQQTYGGLGSSFQSDSIIPVCDSSFFIPNAKIMDESAISSSFIPLVDANSNHLPFGSSNSSLLSVVDDSSSYLDFRFPFQSSAAYSDFVSLSMMSAKRNSCEADNLVRTERDLVTEEFMFADENSENFFDSTKYGLCSS